MKGYLIDPYKKVVVPLVTAHDNVLTAMEAERGDFEDFDDGNHVLIYDAGASEAATGGYRFEGIFLAGRAAVFGKCIETGDVIDSSLSIDEVISRIEWGYSEMPRGCRIRVEYVKQSEASRHSLADLVSDYLKASTMTGFNHPVAFEQVATALTENYEMVEELLQLCHRAVAIKR